MMTFGTAGACLDRRNTVRIDAGIIMAMNEDEAKGKALRYLQKKYPPGRFSRHSVEVTSEVCTEDNVKPVA